MKVQCRIRIGHLLIVRKWMRPKNRKKRKNRQRLTTKCLTIWSVKRGNHSENLRKLMNNWRKRGIILQIRSLNRKKRSGNTNSIAWIPRKYWKPSTHRTQCRCNSRQMPPRWCHVIWKRFGRCFLKIIVHFRLRRFSRRKYRVKIIKIINGLLRIGPRRRNWCRMILWRILRNAWDTKWNWWIRLRGHRLGRPTWSSWGRVIFWSIGLWRSLRIV